MQFFMKVVGHMNLLAVIVSGVVYWLLGAVWFSLLFGKTWGSELEKHGVKIKDSAQGSMAGKFIGTFIMELIICFSCAFLVGALSLETLPQAIKFGLGVGICISALPMLIAYSWESRPMKLQLIDIGYPVLGVTVAMIILTLWR